MYKNFLISGSGRSGTRFLVNLMNRSETWTVLHEPHPKHIRNNIKENVDKIQKVFERDYYGEVNSMRRRILMDLDVEKRGVLIRNPFEIWLSIANRKLCAKRKFNRKGGRKKRGQFGVEITKELGDQWIEELDESLHLVDKAIEGGAYPIYFHRMIKLVPYTQKVLEHFGIDDVEVTQEILNEKINATPTYHPFETIEDIPLSVAKVHEVCDWFYDKHLRGKP